MATKRTHYVPRLVQFLPISALQLSKKDNSIALEIIITGLTDAIVDVRNLCRGVDEKTDRIALIEQTLPIELSEKKSYMH